MTGHRSWRITRDGRLRALSPDERAEALAAIEQAEMELRAEPGAPKCGHCGRPRRGYRVRPSAPGFSPVVKGRA